MTALPLERTRYAGVYRRGSRYVVVYRSGGRQRKQAAGTLVEARAIKLARDAEARAERRGPTLHAYALAWVDRYSGSGRDSVRENTHREYRRLLTTFALRYFDRELRLRDLDRVALQWFVDWLTSRPGRSGRLCDRSVANALTPLRAALDAAVAEGLLEQNPANAVVLPRRRGGRAWEFRERRFLTRAELARLLDEVPPKWRALFDLLAATGLRIRRRSRCAGATSSSTRPHRGYGSAERSFAASRARRSRATGRDSSRCRPTWPRACASCARRRRPTTRSSFRVARARRQTWGVSAGGCSCRRPSGRACPASGFTPYATPARRC